MTAFHSFYSVAQQDTIFKIFQFPANMIPCIDGNADDWSIVPEEYYVGNKFLVDDNKKYDHLDPKNLDIKIIVGWVEGMNRLYFLYEVYDDYWDYSRTDLHHDIFEVVVDGDQSGGPLIDRFHPNTNMDKWDKYFSFHGVHAQNYHIYTPAEGQDWALAWGCQPWIKDLPYANVAYTYDFKPGESGKLIMEFWITPFDYAGAEGPERAVESILKENKNIGLCWAFIDFDDVNAQKNNGFWNLSDKHTMYGKASELRTFKLMPLLPELQPKIDARWDFKVIDMNRRLVAFQDKSIGNITSWKWDFGDETASTEQHPIHTYKEAGMYIVTLYIEGPDGKSRRAKVWDVTVR
ncbi:MAG: PKD domain-containing protein [Bacteroidales bacterium]|nr:PKD domain-containing protein [Bacteroidales bacterium]